MPTGHPITEETRVYVIKHYANTPNKELCSFLGISKTTIDRIAMKYHLKKSREHYHEMAIRAGKASSVSRGGKALNITPEVIKKRAATYSATRKSEEIRYKWGLPQKTKIRLKKEPRQKHDQRVRLQSFGYIIDEVNLIAYYTPETRRAKRLEAIPRGQTKGKLKSFYEFRPYEEKQ